MPDIELADFGDGGDGLHIVVGETVTGMHFKAEPRGSGGALARAIEMGVYVVRAFVQLREMLASNKELARRFAQLETRLEKKLVAHDEAIAAILSAIRQLMHPPVPKRRPIGFTADLN